MERIILQGTLGFSLFGETGLVEYLHSVKCCRLHTTVTDVLGIDCLPPTGLAGGFVRHPAISAADAGITRECYAHAEVLRVDRQAAMAALAFLSHDCSYLHSGGLNMARRWRKGSVMGLKKFGKGYCYLALVRPESRLRVARILGPVPLAADVYMMLRVFGAYEADVSVYMGAAGLLHVDSGGRKLVRTVVSTILDELRKFPGLRIGMEDDALGSVVFRKPDGPMDGKRQKCTRCGKSRNPTRKHECEKRKLREFCDVCETAYVLDEGHELRCRPAREKDPVRELLGDALHALDVKTVVVLAVDEGYTERAVSYIMAEAQKDYMDMVGIKLHQNSSVRSYASEFERLYSGDFRYEYVRWLLSQFELKAGSVIERMLQYRSVLSPVVCEVMEDLQVVV